MTARSNEIRVPRWKRSCDVVVSSLGLLLLSPFLAIIAALIKIDSPGSVFFRQERIGQGLRTFSIYKFRTMVVDASKLGGPLTIGDDPRITRVGRILRKSKIDELPQLINVLRGEMTLVGPRPEVQKYVNLFQRDYEDRYLKDDQVSVFFVLADFLHSAFSCANCSAERIPFACLRNVLRLSFVQPAFMHSACHASILLC